MEIKKRKRPVSYLPEAMDALRRAGWRVVERVEYWQQFPSKRPGERPKGFKKDLLGCLDIFCCGVGGFLGVQVTSWAQVPTRLKKIIEEPRAMGFLEAGGVIEVWGYRKEDGETEIRKERLTMESVKF